MQDKCVQTELDAEGQAKPREKEKAIVVPTQRETEKLEEATESSESETETVFSETEPPMPDLRPSNQRQSIGSVSTVNQDVGGNSVSIFYVNELARKEIELAECRLVAREHECALRELRWKYNVDTFK